MVVNDSKEFRVSVMQPYIFPYLGYMQLIAASDHFVSYDDVNFIKQGWINRNRILLNGEPHTFTIPCQGISSNVFIHQIPVDYKRKEYLAFLKTVEQSYKKAPYFDIVFPLIQDLWYERFDSVASLAMASLKLCCRYLDVNTVFHVSSEQFPGLTELYRADRLIHIVKELKGDTYLNLSGGKVLYDKSYFSEREIALKFHSMLPVSPYSQLLSNQFHANLSIIDLMMNLPKEEIQNMLMACLWE